MSWGCTAAVIRSWMMSLVCVRRKITTHAAQCSLNTTPKILFRFIFRAAEKFIMAKYLVTISRVPAEVRGQTGTRGYPRVPVTTSNSARQPIVGVSLHVACCEDFKLSIDPERHWAENNASMIAMLISETKRRCSSAHRGRIPSRGLL